ncbi:LytR/AlgR family response regulator transcription factor [Larkinella sp. VNQ87]|uniref:LytR/AlgR family response regulator transcription factor n=1 Tax=Larkinella sp. VNQ87 TaxID=3400921 RepID=UPI003BFF8230
MSNCLLVEDEPLAQQVIETYIRQTAGLNLVEVCYTALEAFEVLNRIPIDLLFLDIQLPSLTGVDLIRRLKEPPAVIFTTAYTDYAVESYELNAIDYLLKPITYDRFRQSVSKFLKTKPVYSSPKAHTYFKVNGQLVKIAHNEILYAQSIKDYILIKTAQRQYITHLTMKSLTEQLPTRDFRRVHRSFIVNLAHITALGKQEVEIERVKKVPIGENYRAGLVDGLLRR